jgi:hypothetical protein
MLEREEEIDTEAMRVSTLKTKFNDFFYIEKTKSVCYYESLVAIKMVSIGTFFNSPTTNPMINSTSTLLQNELPLDSRSSYLHIIMAYNYHLYIYNYVVIIKGNHKTNFLLFYSICYSHRVSRSPRVSSLS